MSCKSWNLSMDHMNLEALVILWLFVCSLTSLASKRWHFFQSVILYINQQVLITVFSSFIMICLFRTYKKIHSRKICILLFLFICFWNFVLIYIIAEKVKTNYDENRSTMMTSQLPNGDFASKKEIREKILSAVSRILTSSRRLK